MNRSDMLSTEGVNRIARAQAAMARKGLAALLVMSGTNLIYLTGYPTIERALARPMVAIVPAMGAPILIAHVSRALEARRYSWVEDVRTYEQLSIAPIATISQAFGDANLRHGLVGAELGFEQRLGVPLLELERIREGIAPLEVVDAADLLWSLRSVKSAAEIRSMREACRITAAAYARVLPGLRPGMSEWDVTSALKAFMLASGGAEPRVAITSGRGNYDLVSSPGSDRLLAAGDLVWVDSGCTVGGYWADFGRAAVMGSATSDQRALQAEIHAITMAGVALARPSTPVAEIAAVVEDRLANLEMPLTSSISGLAGRIGHGLGLDPAEPPHVAVSDRTVLRPGMVITIEPGVATAFGTFHIEEQLVVTDGEPDILSESPRTLVEVKL